MPSQKLICRNCQHNSEKKTWKTVKCSKVDFDKLSPYVIRAIMAGELECFDYTPIQLERKGL